MAENAATPVAETKPDAAPAPVVAAKPRVTPVPLPRPVAVLGQPGSVVQPDRTGELAPTVKAVPDGAAVVVRDREDVSTVSDLLMEAGKRCSVIVQPGLGVRSLWRQQRSRP